VEDLPGNKKTPIGQQHLFAQPGTRQSDDVEDDDNNCNKSLLQLYNQSLELDMDQANQEAKEDGDGDSKCSAAKAGEVLFPQWKSQRGTVIVENYEDILCDTALNAVEIKRGLGPGVKVCQSLGHLQL
jgi:hypothetical protein